MIFGLWISYCTISFIRITKITSSNIVRDPKNVFRNPTYESGRSRQKPACFIVYKHLPSSFSFYPHRL